MHALVCCLLVFGSALQASVPEPLELGLMGLPLISVQLADAQGTLRTCRFILDTGANGTILDSSLAARFAVATKVKAEVTGATGATVGARQIRIHGLVFGATRLADLEAVAMDLSTTFGAMEDGPLEGILGMNALRGLRFELDVAGGRILWGASRPEGLHEARLRWSSSRLPMLRVAFSNKLIDLTCDTGSGGLVDLLEEDLAGLKNPDPGTNGGLSMEVTGSVVAYSKFTMKGVLSVGTKGWLHPEVDGLVGGDAGLLGMRAFLPKVWFDFESGRIGLAVGADGNLQATAGYRSPLHAKWVTRDGVRHLAVLAVKPGSPYEKAGIKPGDRLLAVDALDEAHLSIRSLRELLSRGDAQRVLVERDQQPIAFRIDCPPTR